MATKERKLSSKENLEVSLGGTDAIKIVKGEWKDIWEIKTGRAEPDDLSEVLPVQMGVYTEPFNIQWFQKQTGLKVVNNNKVYTSPDIEFLHATIDGEIKSEEAIFEAKHVSPFSAKDVVDRYYPQLQHYMIVTRLKKAYLSVLIGNLQHKIYEIKPDYEFMHKLIYAQTYLWNYIQYDIQPPDYVDFEAFCSRKEKLNGLTEKVKISVPSWLQETIH